MTMKARTILDISAEELRTYQPGKRVQESHSAERWKRAWEVAQKAARLLRQKFGATRVVAFGSLAHRKWFGQWSDIDLAAWGISAYKFYRAVAVVTGLSPEFKIDLLDPESCRPSLREKIEREGVEL